MARSVKTFLGFACMVGALGMGCGSENSDAPQTDGGADSDSGDNLMDASTESDAGAPDAGNETDAGPDEPECTEGCEFVELALSYATTCARRENGEVFCWGNNYAGELGDDSDRHDDCTSGGAKTVDCSETPVKTKIEDVISIGAHGGRGICGVKADGSLYCWGAELIDKQEGSEKRLFEPVEVELPAAAASISMQFSHACIEMMDGTAMCWGGNNSGQVGNGTHEDAYAPVGVVGPMDGDPALSGVTQIEVAAGSGTSCAIADGSVYCWGSNSGVEFGVGEDRHETCSHGMGTYDCSSRPVMIPDFENVTDIAMGSDHACAIREGSLYCWGSNYFGQLGNGTTSESRTPALVEGISDATQVVAGDSHTCVLVADGTVSCFGSDQHGKVGDGEEDAEYETCQYGSELVECNVVPTEVTELTDAVHIAAGLAHTCAIRETGDIVCWGWSDRYQVGNGTRDDVYEPAMVLGLGDN